jgi:hypothetical protein
LKVADGLPKDDVGADARAVLVAVAEQIRAARPEFLANVHADWSEPFLGITLVHRDGTVLEVGDGDRYTTLVGGGVDFHGRLAPGGLSSVLVAALTGRLSYIRVSGLGLKVADHFEIDGRVGEQLGYDTYGIAGMPGMVLGRVPLIPHARLRIRVRFDRTPAVSSSYE